MRGVGDSSPTIRPWTARRTSLLVGQYLITLAAQFLHACSDRREIIGGAGPGHLAQFLHSSSDHREIIGSVGSGRHTFLRSSLSSQVATVIADVASTAAARPPKSKRQNCRPADKPKCLPEENRRTQPVYRPTVVGDLGVGRTSFLGWRRLPIKVSWSRQRGATEQAHDRDAQQ